MGTLIDKVAIRLYSLINRHRFANLGDGSRLFPPVVADCAEAIFIGKGVLIKENTWLNAQSPEACTGIRLRIGDNSYIGPGTHINACKSVEIQSDVLIADRVFITDYHHATGDTARPIIEQGIEFAGPVLICTGSWIGVNSVIMPGVKVGRHSIVGANSVVTKNVPDFAVVAGAPAKVIRYRKP